MIHMIHVYQNGFVHNRFKQRDKALIGNPVEARDFRARPGQTEDRAISLPIKKSMNLIIHAVTYD